MAAKNTYRDSMNDCISNFITAESLEQMKSMEERLDVLHIVSPASTPWPPPIWFLEKASRWTKQLRLLGFKAVAMIPQALGVRMNVAAEHLLQLHPRVIVSRAFAVPTNFMVWSAVRAPDITFVQVNHTPNSFVVSADDRGPIGWWEAVEASCDMANVWIGSVSARDVEMTSVLNPKCKATWIPNPCRDDLYADRSSLLAEPRVPVHIGLAARVKYQKNLKNQIDAVAVIGRLRPTVLHLFLEKEEMPGMHTELVRYAQRCLAAAGVKLHVARFIPPLEFINYARSKLDLFLHVTFDESFGYLPWEMMAVGVPTISSEAPEVTGIVTVNPASVLDIAAAIELILADILKYRQAAIDKAVGIERLNNPQFERAFREILSKSDNESVSGDQGHRPEESSEPGALDTG